MQLNSLTIEIKMTSDGIAAYSVELLEGCVADTADHAISALMRLIESRIVSGEIEHNDFVVQMITGGDKDEFDTWLEDANYQIKLKVLHDAFFKAYPKASNGPLSHMNVPFHDWESNAWNAFQEAAYNGLINNGPEDATWIDYVQKVCGSKYFQYRECDRAKVYKRWKSYGLPVMKESELTQLYKKEGWKAFHINEEED